ESGVQQERIVALPPAPPDEMVRTAAAFDVGLAVEPGTTRNNDIAVSNKVFTYLLAGLAVIGTRTQGQRELLDAIPHAAAGVEPGDLTGLAKAIDVWHRNRLALDDARRAAVEYAVSRYNWDRERQVFLAAVSSALRPARETQIAQTPIPVATSQLVATPR